MGNHQSAASTIVSNSSRQYPSASSSYLSRFPSQALAQGFKSSGQQASSYQIHSRSGKKTIHEINQSVSGMISDGRQKQQFKQAQEETPIRGAYSMSREQWVHQSMTNAVQSTSPRSFCRFYQDQQQNRMQIPRGVKQSSKDKENAERNQIQFSSKSVSPQRDNRLAGRPPIAKKYLSITKDNRNRNDQKGYHDWSQINLKKVRISGKEHSDKFAQTLDAKATIPFPTNSLSEKASCLQLIENYQEAVEHTAKDICSLSYVEFGELLRRVGFVRQSANDVTPIDLLLAKERTLVYQAWKHLEAGQTVHSQDVLSFIFAVMGSDLKQYLPASIDDSFTSRQTVVPRSHKHNKSWIHPIPQERDERFPNTVRDESRCNNLPQHENQVVSADQFSESGNTLGMGYIENGRLYYNESDILKIHRHFNTFYTNFLGNGSEFAKKSDFLATSRSKFRINKTPTAKILRGDLQNQRSSKWSVGQSPTVLKPIPSAIASKMLPIRHIKAMDNLRRDISQQALGDELPTLRTDQTEEQLQYEIRGKQPISSDLNTILHVDIRVNSQQTERISLRLEDDPFPVALGFLQKHRLNPNLAHTLTSVLQMNIDKVRQQSLNDRTMMVGAVQY